MNRSSARTAAAASVLCALVLTGCQSGTSGSSDSPTSGSTATSANAGPSESGQPGSALAAARALTVKGRAPKTGYSRIKDFGKAWTDDNTDLWGHNGCDTRDDILKRDLFNTSFKDARQCKVKTGDYHDPYSGDTIHLVRGVRSSAVLQIDHVVPLSNAWQTGAQSWPQSKRVDYANDPLVLLTSKGTLNDNKGDSDAASWLPPNKAFRPCYAALMVAIRTKYGLWTTQADKDMLIRLLSAQPTMKLPTEPGGVCH